jgi:hypothetical protein
VEIQAASLIGTFYSAQWLRWARGKGTCAYVEAEKIETEKARFAKRAFYQE